MASSSFQSRLAAFVLAMVAFMASVALAADVIRIDEPTDNAQLSSNTEISFKYTVIGAQSGTYLDIHALGHRVYFLTG